MYCNHQSRSIFTCATSRNDDLNWNLCRRRGRSGLKDSICVQQQLIRTSLSSFSTSHHIWVFAHVDCVPGVEMLAVYCAVVEVVVHVADLLHIVWEIRILHLDSHSHCLAAQSYVLYWIPPMTEWWLITNLGPRSDPTQAAQGPS